MNKLQGSTTEYQCVSKFLELGYMVSLPVSHFAVYDLIVDIGNNMLLRIQVKSSHAIQGGFSFNCTSTRINSKGAFVHKYTEEEIDYIATIFNNILYLIPVSECSNQKTLRIDPPKNMQITKVNWAVQYEASHVISVLKNPDIFGINISEKLKQASPVSNSKQNYKHEYKYRWITNDICNKKFYGDIACMPQGFHLGRK